MTETRSTWLIRDYDGELGSFGVITTPILDSGLNFADINNDLDDLIAAALPLTRADGFSKKTLSDIDRETDLPATDPNCQRESKWEIQYRDTQEFIDAPLNLFANKGYNKKFVCELPCALFAIREDHSELIWKNGPVLADPGYAPLVQTFVTAFNTVARSPYGGNVEVLQIKSVGRNT